MDKEDVIHTHTHTHTHTHRAILLKYYSAIKRYIDIYLSIKNIKSCFRFKDDPSETIQRKTNTI